MIILGIDPGTTRIGYGIIEKTRAGLGCLGYGVIGQPTNNIGGIVVVIKDLNKIVRKYKPDLVGLEKIFYFKNQKTVISVSEMRGVILSVLAVNKIPVNEFTPLQVKQAVSSYGRAGKDQVQEMVRIILHIEERIKLDDAADGLAIAICCANTILE